MTFNLIDEPWILVQTTDGPEELSLRAVFADSHRVRLITGEVPTQGFAILRLLLAICHDAIGWHSQHAIKKLHREGLNLAAVDHYLDTHHDRFDLFHPERPFMQVADLRTGRGEHSGLHAIIADLPNNARLFSTRAGRGIERISAGEAARWLVHAHAFDPSGIRSQAVGDALGKGGRGYPIGPGWAGQIGGIALHGDHLEHTLRLNLAPTSDSSDDVPVWRWQHPQTEQREEDIQPCGPIQTLVWQSRRTRLVGDRDGVHGVVLCQGDRLMPQRMLGSEPMTGWRYSVPQSKKFGWPVYMPNLHDPGRSMWRGLPAMMTPGVEKVEDGGFHDRFAPVATIEAAEASGQQFVLQVIGVQYGPQNATIEEIIDDRMELSSALLERDAVPTRLAIRDAVGTADTCVRGLGQLAANLARAAGEKGDSAGDGARQRAMAEAWAALDVPARRWIGALDQAETPNAIKAAWQQTVEDIVGRLAERLVDSAGPAALRGRQTSFGFMSAHRAHNFFVRDLRKELSLIHPTTKETQA